MNMLHKILTCSGEGQHLNKWYDMTLRLPRLSKERAQRQTPEHLMQAQTWKIIVGSNYFNVGRPTAASYLAL